MERTLEGKVALVTGGGQGVGRAIALALAAEGARVAVCGRTGASIDAVAKKIRESGGGAKAYRLDVRDRADVDKTVARAAAEVVDGRKPRLDLLVNNAGVNALTPVGGDDAVWMDVIDTNLNGAMRVARAALRVMPDGGRVVNLASTMGKTGAAGYGAYCASKAAIIGWTRALALELAPRHVTVNAVCPGWTENDLSSAVVDQMAARSGRDPVRVRRRVEEHIPLARFVEPAEVADLVAFLCGPGAAMITAQAISVCGGEGVF